MQVVLAMFRSDGERRSFSVVRDMTVIGRREDCDLRIPLGDVSRKHCRLIKDGDSVKIEDLGSSNGTFHNGARVQEAILAPGDRVQVGPVTFVVQIDGMPADENLQPGEVAPPQPAAAIHPALADVASDVNPLESEPTQISARPAPRPPLAPRPTAVKPAPAPARPAPAKPVEAASDEPAELDFTLDDVEEPAQPQASATGEEPVPEELVDFELEETPNEPTHPQKSA